MNEIQYSEAVTSREAVCCVATPNPVQKMRLFHSVLLTFGLIVAQPSDAQTSAQIKRLMNAGELIQAENQLLAALKLQPKDAELRFLLGVVLTDLKRPQEAVRIFTDLSHEYPELPDPLNNLAVLHAAQGDIDAARSALEAALRKNPQHRAANENLGDVYLRLAVRQWQRAAGLATPDPSLTLKLSLAQNLLQSTTKPGAASTIRP
jgi:Flp pilus assembly protein TadD